MKNYVKVKKEIVLWVNNHGLTLHIDGFRVGKCGTQIFLYNNGNYIGHVNKHSFRKAVISKNIGNAYWIK
jgi:hypothetical protein